MLFLLYYTIMLLILADVIRLLYSNYLYFNKIHIKYINFIL